MVSTPIALPFKTMNCLEAMFAGSIMTNLFYHCGVHVLYAEIGRTYVCRLIHGFHHGSIFCFTFAHIAVHQQNGKGILHPSADFR